MTKFTHKHTLPHGNYQIFILSTIFCASALESVLIKTMGEITQRLECLFVLHFSASHSQPQLCVELVLISIALVELIVVLLKEVYLLSESCLQPPRLSPDLSQQDNLQSDLLTPYIAASYVAVFVAYSEWGRGPRSCLPMYGLVLCELKRP